MAPSTLPPRSTARSTSTEPGFIEATIAAVTSFGAGRPGISAVVMTMSCLAMCSAVSAACLAWYSLRHLLGVAAGGLGVLELLVLDGEELGAERFDLLLGRGAHVGGGDHRAEAPAVAIACRPATPTPMMNTFAAGTVPAAVIIIGKARSNASAAVDHRLVAGEVGLAGQHVHRLRAGDARHELHREGGDAGLGQRLQRGVIAVGIHDGDDQRAGLVARQLDASGRRTLSTMSASLHRVGGADRRAGRW